MWILGAIALVAVLGLAFSRNQTELVDNTDERIKSRVDAYVDYIKRENPHERFAKMSDNELKDDLATKIRRFPKDLAQEKAKAAAVPTIIMCAVVLLSFIDVLEGFPVIFSICAGLFVMYREENKATVKIEAEYEEQGYSVERLKLD